MNLLELRNDISRIENVDFHIIKECKIGQPLMTIAIPTFNRAEELRNAVIAALEQDCAFPYEILVIDNNPNRNDRTELMMESFKSEKISYYKNAENVGMVGNWNQGLIAAKAAWVVYCHDDDLLDVHALKNIQEMINKHPECKGITSKLIQKGNPFSKGGDTGKKNVYRSNASIIRKMLSTIIKAFIPRGLPIVANLFCDNLYGPPTCGFCINKQAFLDFGGWWEGYIVSDWATMIGFSQRYKVVKNEHITGTYIWAKNISLNSDAIRTMSDERKEILNSLPQVSILCNFYKNLLDKDFKRKDNELLTDFSGSRSLLFRLITRYYKIRIR